MEGGGAFSGGEGKKAAAMASVGDGVAEVMRRPKPNFGDHLFKFCMKSCIVLGCCYFVLLCYIAISNLHLDKLYMLPFFGVAVTAPLYAAALLKEWHLEKSCIALGSCYFVLLSYIAISNPHL